MEPRRELAVNQYLKGAHGGVVSVVIHQVVSTRLYNQPVDARGKGLTYRGFLDCLYKTITKEGFFGLYKGAGAAYARVGPHSIVSLCIWDYMRAFYYKPHSQLR